MADNKFDKSKHTIWVEKYRPQTLEQYLGNDTLKSAAKKIIDSKDIPHMLLAGDPGIGKCLDGSEKIDIEIEVTDSEYEILKQYLNPQ